MKQGRLIMTLVALPVLIAGCDIFDVDNMDAPDSLLTGRVVFGGEPVGVRNPTGSAQILLWQTDWDVDNPNRIESSIPVYLNPSGEFSAMLFDGEYEIEMVNNSGPWQNDATPRSRTVSVRGDTEIDLPVQPYYTIADENIVFTPPAAGDTTGGRITATFRVAQHVSTPLVDLVGLYVNTTTFVDATRRDTSLRGSWTYPIITPGVANPTPAGQSAANPHQRVRAQIQTQLTNNQPISITLILPSNIRLTPSPEPRTSVYVRVGVKPVGLTEQAYTQVYKIDI